MKKNGRNPLEKALDRKPLDLTLLKAIPKVGVVVILGFRGEGKTALACRIMEEYHTRYDTAGAILYFPKSARRLLPTWVKKVDSIAKLPKNSVCIIDEAAQEAHARRFQSSTNIDLEELASLSRQRSQLILLVSHHSRKLDISLITDSDLLLYKKPTEAHYLFERTEVQPITRKVLDEFYKKKGITKPWVFVIDLHHLRLGWTKFKVPSFWSDKLSTWVGLIGKERAKPKKKEPKEPKEG